MSLSSTSIVSKSLLIVAFINFLLAAIKIYAGFSGNSLSLLGDGIDSGTDVIAGILSFLAARLVRKPADHSFPYGYGRAETLATWLVGSFIFMIGFQLVIQSVFQIVSGQNKDLPAKWLIYIILPSIGIKTLISLVLFPVAKSMKSSLLRATAVNMRADVLLGFSVLAGIVSSLYSGESWYDLFFGFCIGIWIIRSAYEIFKESYIELMDGLKDEKLYRKVNTAVNRVDQGLNPHRMRIRQIARKYIVSLDIEVDGKLNVNEGHKIAQEVENAIAHDIADVYDVLVHVEPRGNRENETFGIQSRDVGNH